MHHIDSRLTIEQAWEVSQAHREAFDKHVALFDVGGYYDVKWSPDSPFWAYWVARFIITDHWPAAELLIASNERVQIAYKGYIAVLRNIRILGHTTEEPAPIPQLTKRSEKETIWQRAQRRTIGDLDEHAARIAKTVQDIKQRKKSTKPDDPDQWDIQSDGDS